MENLIMNTEQDDELINNTGKQPIIYGYTSLPENYEKLTETPKVFKVGDKVVANIPPIDSYVNKSSKHENRILLEERGILTITSVNNKSRGKQLLRFKGHPGTYESEFFNHVPK